MRWWRRVFVLPIRAYQRLISPFLGNRCRFYPSCSEFSIQAIERYGVFFGLVKTIGRLLRCHPLCPGGYEPVEKAWPRLAADRRQDKGA